MATISGPKLSGPACNYRKRQLQPQNNNNIEKGVCVSIKELITMAPFTGRWKVTVIPKPIMHQ